VAPRASMHDLPPEVATYLRRVLGTIEGLLPEELVGVYLLGSLAMGGYVAGRSDIDVAVVVDGDGLRSRMQRLAELIAHPTLPCPAPKLELVVYPRSSLRGARPSLDQALNLNTGPEVGTRATYEPDDEPRHWFVLDVAMARDHARTLVGPSPAHVFPSLDRERVRIALLASLSWHEAHDDAGIASVLNAARALRFTVTGTWSSKRDAATWAIGAGPDPELVAKAIDLHEGRGSGGLDRDRAAGFLAAVRMDVVGACET
jgi:hypothetical protein